MPQFNGQGEDNPAKKALEHRAGKKKFAREMAQINQMEDREEIERHHQLSAPNIDIPNPDGTVTKYNRGRITQPRCHVCQHPYRDWIETMLIRGASYKGLQDRIPPLQGHDKLDRRSISNHKEKHMDLQDAALRAILEREADLQNQNYEEGVEGAITKRGVLETMLQRGFQDMVSGVTTVEAKDLIQVARVLGDMDSHQQAIGLDELRTQVAIFIQAIKDVCDQEIQNAIAARVKQLRNRDNITTQFESVMQPAIPAEATVIE